MPGPLIAPFSDIATTIRKRRSCRNFEEIPLSESDKRRFESVVATPPATPFGHPVNLVLVDREGPDASRLSSYGVIRGAKTYLTGSVRDNALEDFGFFFEWAILIATEMGFGTCWLGGTLTRDAFAGAMGAGDDEEVPSVTPIGYPAPGRTLVDRVFRSVAGSDGRKPWSELFFSESFETPLSSVDAGPYTTPLEMVRIGPSASNAQPWRVVKARGRNVFHFYLFKPVGHGLFNRVDLQRVDLGIAFCHFEAAATAANLAGRWEKQDDPALEAKLPDRTRYVASWIGE